MSISTATEVELDPRELSLSEGGPFSGPLSRATSHMPQPLRGPLVEAGGMAQLLVRAMWSAIRHPRGYWRDVVVELDLMFRGCILSISVALFGFLLTICIPSVQFTVTAGVPEYFGPLLFAVSIRLFTVWITALLVAGVVGAAITAELGARKVREEIDAMQVMGIDPVRSLVVPRMVAVTLGTCLMTVPAALSTVASIQIAAAGIGGINRSAFDAFLWANITPFEFGSMLLNSLLCGLLIATVCCYKGMNAGGGAVGLGKAVNQAVVISFVGLFVLQLAYNAVVLGLFPELGAFR